MKILVISDTHIPVVTNKLPYQIIQETKKAQLCLHAGDFISYKVFEELSSHVKVVGVRGNMDTEEVKKKLPEKEIIEVEGIRIGLIHGRGAPSSLISYIEEKFYEEIKTLNIIVFGHSHNPMIRKINNRIYFNPGSPTDKFFAPYNSYGILNIERGNIEPQIIRI
ncbi:MAG: hypothetical protein B6D56_02150 [Candidatus Omnitrophica bacterium 4484_70.1]|nr:MAG: hypothetical protein B6D56_02150 [Candidatus Omnitrophica bacterium 4484_70.1]